MSKARKVKVAAKPAKAPQRIHRTKAQPKRAESKAEPKAEARHEAKARHDEPEKPKAPKGLPAGLARAALLAAAAAGGSGDDEPEVVARPAPKKGGGVAWEDFEDDEDAPPAKAEHKAPVPPAPRPAAPAPPAESPDGVQVVSRGPSKFSMADIEALRSAIKVKGAAALVEGINLEELKWDGEGLVPVLAQDRRTGAVLQLGAMNRDTLEKSLRSRQVTYWSRDHQREQPAQHQRLVKAHVDCDKDSILLVVEQEGPACHRDTATCYVEGRTLPLAGFLGELDAHLASLAKAPDGSAAAKQLADPIEALRGFVGHANELSKSLQGKGGNLEDHAAGLLQALLVACRAKGVGLERLVNSLYAQHLASQVKKGEKGEKGAD